MGEVDAPMSPEGLAWSEKSSWIIGAVWALTKLLQQLFPSKDCSEGSYDVRRTISQMVEKLLVYEIFEHTRVLQVSTFFMVSF